MTNLFKKLAAFALLITLSGTQITQTRSYNSDYDYGTQAERRGFFGKTVGGAFDATGSAVKGTGRVAGGAVEGAGNVTNKTVRGTGKVVTGTADAATSPVRKGTPRRQRVQNRRYGSSKNSTKARSSKTANQKLATENL